MQGLIIKPYWGNLILSGEKTWEIRGSQTHKRGKIGIIISGTGKVWGTVDLVDCFPCTLSLFGNNHEKHRIMHHGLLARYKQPWTWVLENPVKYPEPVPYSHPQGAVIWVNLKEFEQPDQLEQDQRRHMREYFDFY